MAHLPGTLTRRFYSLEKGKLKTPWIWSGGIHADHCFVYQINSYSPETSPSDDFDLDPVIPVHLEAWPMPPEASRDPLPDEEGLRVAQAASIDTRPERNRTGIHRYDCPHQCYVRMVADSIPEGFHVRVRIL